MTSIGETLRRERLRQGLDFQQVSHSTKIGTRMLQAMEADDFSKLPGGVFTRSFIKQYASALGLDPASLEPELKALHVEGDEARRPDTRPDRGGYSFSALSDRGPEPNSLAASVVWVLLALLVCGGVYYIMNRNSGSAPDKEQAARALPAKPDAAVPEPHAEAPATPAPDPASDQASAAPEKTADAPTSATDTAPGDQPAAGGPVEVVLSASEPAWISVTADGKRAFIGTLRAHEKREFSASERMKLVAGNAGGLEISLNGKPIEAIGPRGQVRVVELTPEGAHVIPRTPPNPAPLL